MELSFIFTEDIPYCLYSGNQPRKKANPKYQSRSQRLIKDFLMYDHPKDKSSGTALPFF